ncbi:MAG: PBP1A family penicillin-binding protein [Clostridia bacterium]|nr:PBP1A family penicillin-binding protein [Clostridia bacterium]
MKHARNGGSGSSSGNRKSPRQTNLSAKNSVIAKKKVYKKKNRSLAGLKAIAVILLIACLVVVLGVGSGMYAAISKEIDAMDFDSVAYNFSSTLFADDSSGNSHEIAHLHSDGNREWIDSDKIPDIAKIAAVSIEDERFYKHKGIDLKRTFGATLGWVWAKITHSSVGYGGSTITQQVIKNITNEKDKTATRKIKEMMRAVALEKRFTKDEILTVYLNIVYFGNQCYGIESASKVYFSKNAADLTIPQAAMIVGITQAPSRYDPFRKPEETIKKRNTVLKKMYKLGHISEDEYKKYSESALGVNSKYISPSSSVYSYFVDHVINDVVAALQTEKGYSKDFATQQILGGGLKIYTTMNYDIQEAMESVYTNTSNFPGASSGTQSAMVVIDPYTGEIKGIVGGIGKKTESRGLNRATQSTRQPGSSIKPLSVYSPALETGKITAASIINDSPITIGEWTPKNAYKGFKGDITVRKALEISSNTAAVKTLKSVGIDTSYNFMTKKYNFSSIIPDDKNYSPLSLGGLTKGVSVKEMAAAYSVFVNKGVYITPHTYTKVLDSTGKVLLEFTPKSSRVLSEANAFIMTSFLYEVVNGSAGTGRSAKLANMPTYGKTGTTNSNHDKWFVGFTPYYVGAVWYGYDNKPQGVSTNASVSIWKKVMAKVHENLPEKEIPVPSNVTSASICQRTGKLASPGCKYAHAEYFVKGTVPSKYCNNSSGNYTDSGNQDEPSPESDNTSENGENIDSETGDNSINLDSTEHSDNNATQQIPSARDNQPQSQSGGEDVITLD